MIEGLAGLGDPSVAGPEGGEVQFIASGWRLALSEFLENRLAVFGLAVIVLFFLFCFLGPLFHPTNQLLVNPLNTDLAPGGAHLLGTDEHGFDEFGRIMLGGQSAPGRC